MPVINHDFISPLNYISQLVPQSDGKVLRQAFYNTLAIVFLIILATATVSVYFILQAFLRPLIWALIIGSCLHPLKCYFANCVKHWYEGVQTSERSLIVSLIFLPVSSTNNLLDFIYIQLCNYAKTLFCFIMLLPLIYIIVTIYYIIPIDGLISIIVNIFMYISNFLSFFTTYWVFLVVILYASLVVFYWTSETQILLRYLSFPVWIAGLVHISSLTGVFRVPLFLLLIFLIILGCIVEFQESGYLNFFGSTGSRSSIAITSDQTPHNSSQETNFETIETPFSSPIPKTPETISAASQPSAEPPSPLLNSKSIFLALLCLRLLIYCLHHLWTVLQLAPILLLFIVVKRLGLGITSTSFVSNSMHALWSTVVTFVNERREALAPFPVRGIFKLLVCGDRLLRQFLGRSIDTLVSILVIVLVLTLSAFLAVFLAIQIQRESIELVTMTSRVLNTTMMTASSSFLPETKNLQKTVDAMMGNAYVLGREWISAKIHTVFDTTDYNKAKIEEQVLQLWDRLYEKLAARNMSWEPVWSVNTTGLPGNSLVRQDSRIFWETATSLLDTSKLLSFVKENLGVLTSVMESVWTLIKGNLSLCLTLFTTALSILFGGGTAVLNFLLSSLVFLTSLYLLLCFSGDLYLPVQFVASLSPTRPNPVMRAFYSAVEDAISGVFLASLKIALFYGVYTNLTHTMFGVNLVFVPSVLAAVFGAVPFLGTYWAALPGVVELWLIHDQALLALLLLVIHFLPTYIVDTVIYSEIKGAGHPYLTGLAVAGGLYWFGLEGAVFGPIMLACLLVAVNVYSLALLPSDDLSAQTGSSQLSSSSSLFRSLSLK